MKKYIISLDQGTTSSRAIVFDKNQQIVGMAQHELPQIYPKEGWVEHDPMEIYATQYGVMVEALTKNNISIDEIAAIGITNQRETTILWDKSTGKPVYNAIVWQCRRTAEICEQLKKDGWEDYIKEATGLLIDAYFSATKVKWILDNVGGLRERCRRGEILFGTVDTWLMWKLSQGKIHATDYSNASRTMMFNINTLQWDKKILEILDIPESMLPEVHPSSHVFGNADILNNAVPIAAVAGDQQASLFGQGCFEKGQAKNTYGTGCFLMMNTGSKPCRSKNNLLTSIAASTKENCVQYVLEGSIFSGGSVVQWMKDELRFFDSSAESEQHACQVNDTGGVYVVPAFTGMGAPYWDMYARGCIMGITRGTKSAHIIRAALESIAFQTHDLVDCMQKDTDIQLTELNVDGGASGNNFLMQFQSDILQIPVRRPEMKEITSLGIAQLAGLAIGLFKNLDDIRALKRNVTVLNPEMEEKKRETLLQGWKKAVSRCRDWVEH
ncbi:glycerol kinase [Treponema ruminis]|uniref:Glycerol kinase n=1 Tax=Treponema ruminis TaxID=744515 RepID=A0A7W8G973_9SPIR|nr:glycerol kinase GlpK [Treponema ruminis]MBB5226121.1 glycerol kinase [Treponema ruminis]QSI02970.1 glycerol kinase [Treponema ruminis]